MRVSLVSAADSIAAARRAVDALLDGNDENVEKLRGNLKLVVTELVTNAVVHGIHGDEIHLTTTLYPAYAYVSVRNSSTFDPRKFWAPNPEGGRGLDIVAALADTWGIESGPNGTIVTLRIRRDRPPGVPVEFGTA